ncbi:MAG: RsbRD N-terminal domain-containing protein [Gemmatimonadota bacterium]|nr:RsbRD N-terminal domain-containing protein [Gemmatimonadota bacterium]
MTQTEPSTHLVKLVDELRAAQETLVKRWLDRIAERMAVHENDVFPTDELLDHVPLLIDGIADYLEDPADEITADVSVVAKAMELGELRHQQQFEAPQILREYEILGGILSSSSRKWWRAWRSRPRRRSCWCAHAASSAPCR